MRPLSWFTGTCLSLLFLPVLPPLKRQQRARFGIRLALSLPGVTVELSSPVLIEKVRTAATDGSGRYQLVDLRPGAYTVTFTLAGLRRRSAVKDVALSWLGRVWLVDAGAAGGRDSKRPFAVTGWSAPTLDLTGGSATGGR